MCMYKVAMLILPVLDFELSGTGFSALGFFSASSLDLTVLDLAFPCSDLTEAPQLIDNIPAIQSLLLWKWSGWVLVPFVDWCVF